MAHVIKYKKLSSVDENELSVVAQEIYNSYVNAGKILDFDVVNTLAGTYAYLRFVDEATADEYLAEMAEISEEIETGSKRGPLERYNEQ
jgi:hypothetical protein